ncbi:MAG: DUF1097 family protein [Firmicutes bacterium]|nr:DUF1097 family protein [Bacillota bacterium]
MFSFGPATFTGCAVFFGSNAQVLPALIPMAIAVILGYISAAGVRRAAVNGKT